MNKLNISDLTDAEIDRVVPIANSPFDRRRRLTVEEIEAAGILYDQHAYTYSELAELFHVDRRTIRYNLEEDYRRARIVQANTGSLREPSSRCLERLHERADYKRSLVYEGKLSVARK